MTSLILMYLPRGFFSMMSRSGGLKERAVAGRPEKDVLIYYQV